MNHFEHYQLLYQGEKRKIKWLACKRCIFAFKYLCPELQVKWPYSTTRSIENTILPCAQEDGKLEVSDFMVLMILP